MRAAAKAGRAPQAAGSCIVPETAAASAGRVGRRCKCAPTAVVPRAGVRGPCAGACQPVGDCDAVAEQLGVRSGPANAPWSSPPRSRPVSPPAGAEHCRWPVSNAPKERWTAGRPRPTPARVAAAAGTAAAPPLRRCPRLQARPSLQPRRPLMRAWLHRPPPRARWRPPDRSRTARRS